MPNLMTMLENSARGATIGGLPMAGFGMAPAATLLGAAIGGVAGGKGKRLHGAIHGATRGFGTTAGAGLGGLTLGLPIGAATGRMGAPIAGGATAALMGGGAGGVGGYHAGAGLGNLLTGEDAPWAKKEHVEQKDKKMNKSDNEKSARVYEAADGLDGAKPKVTKMNHQCCSPGEFGMRVKEAIGPTVQASVRSPVEFGAAVKLAFLGEYTLPVGAGAGLGAALGGVSGLINPGGEEFQDDNGRVVMRRRNSRLAAALRGLLMGGLGGGAAGAAMQHFAPNMTNDIYNFGRSALTGKSLPMLHEEDNVARMTQQQQVLHNRSKLPPPKPISAVMPTQRSYRPAAKPGEPANDVDLQLNDPQK